MSGSRAFVFSDTYATVQTRSWSDANKAAAHRNIGLLSAVTVPSAARVRRARPLRPDHRFRLGPPVGRVARTTFFRARRGLSRANGAPQNGRRRRFRAPTRATCPRPRGGPPGARAGPSRCCGTCVARGSLRLAVVRRRARLGNGARRDAERLGRDHIRGVAGRGVHTRGSPIDTVDAPRPNSGARGPRGSGCPRRWISRHRATCSARPRAAPLAPKYPEISSLRALEHYSTTDKR